MIGWICLRVSFVYLSVCGLLFLMQRSMLYHPSGREANVPTLTLKVNAVELVISTNATRCQHAVLYFGGNAEDVSYAAEMLNHLLPRTTIYAAHYRSYGGSSGKPSEHALVADALALFDLVAKNHSQISIVGRSLGSGIAAQVAAARTVRRLVLVTPYNSILEVASDMLKWLPIRLILQDTYETWRFVSRITAPTTLIIAAEDNVIPIQSSLKLAQRFPVSQIRTIVIQAHDHNSISAATEYTEALRGALIDSDASVQ